METEELTEDEHNEQAGKRLRREPHPLCRLLRDLRRASGLSLATIENRYGIPAVVLGAYERGDREPPLRKLEVILAAYGHRLAAVPAAEDAVRLPADAAVILRQVANQLERNAA